MKNINSQESFFIIICFGVIFFMLGFLALKSSMPKMEDKKNTEGRLVDYIESYDRNYGKMWSGVYEFDVDGKIYKITSSVQKRPKELIKEVVKIEYDNADPTINTIASDRLFPMIFIIFSIVFIILGVNMYLESRSENSNINIGTYGVFETEKSVEGIVY